MSSAWTGTEVGRAARTAAFITTIVVAMVAIGGLYAGMPLSDILMCELIAGPGTAIVSVLEAWLFERLGTPLPEPPKLSDVASPAQSSSSETSSAPPVPLAHR